MTVEARIGHFEGAQKKPRPPIPFFPNLEFKPAPENLFSSANDTINWFAQTLPRIEEFRKAMAIAPPSKGPVFQFDVKFSHTNVDYRVKYIASDTKSGLPRRLVLEKSFNTSTFGDGAVVKEKITIVASPDKPVIAWALKVSDGSHPVISEVNTEKAIDQAKSFTAFLFVRPKQEIVARTVKKKDREEPRPEPDEKTEEKPFVYKTLTQGKWQEVKAMLTNPAYRNRQLRRRVENLKWEVKLRTKFRRKGQATAAS